jgi:hypothetical protein
MQFAHPLPTTQVAVNKMMDAVTLVNPDSRYRQVVTKTKPAAALNIGCMLCK